MPRSSTGMRILQQMIKTYTKKLGSAVKGKKKAQQVFYAMEQSGALTSKAFTKKRKKG